ncbi:hypothetical protein M378DRAFT_66832 [Amanita muscaria Koide BX008]|uniref:RlpA-like protein double-psi beta-barrel domain-containing protein n=1 Tax=Amanita muscaria (strain Koide BX008) TaxID=946122 RepID=A0A0C2XNL4_AMAMK|nr:hypothetical protein M378DRAFT_66832 [Amanita muscaria Koide BX008]
MAFTKCLFVLFALAVWVNALTTPHIARAHNHRAIAARLAPATTTTPQAAPSPSLTNSGGNSGSGSSGNSGLPSFLVGTQTGQGTFYSTGLGACGITNQDTDYIAAVSHLLFDAFPDYNGVNPNSNPICNRKVQVHYQGKSVTVAITDRCEGCALTDLDFSPSAFDQLADPSVGRLSGMTWVWI